MISPREIMLHPRHNYFDCLVIQVGHVVELLRLLVVSLIEESYHGQGDCLTGNSEIASLHKMDRHLETENRIVFV